MKEKILKLKEIINNTGWDAKKSTITNLYVTGWIAERLAEGEKTMYAPTKIIADVFLKAGFTVKQDTTTKIWVISA